MNPDVERYSALLSSPDVSARKSAVRALAALDGPEAGEALSRASADADAAVRFLAKTALMKRPATTTPSLSSSLSPASSPPSSLSRPAPAPEPVEEREKEKEIEKEKAKNPSPQAATEATMPTYRAPMGPRSMRPSQLPHPGTGAAVAAAAPGPGSTALVDPGRFKPRGMGELLTDTVSFYAGHFPTVATATAIVNAPFVGLLGLMAMAGLLAPTQDAFVAVMAVSALFKMPLSFLATLATQGVLAKLVADWYLGDTPAVGKSFAFAWERAGVLASAIIVAGVLSVLGTLAGSVLLVIPGLVFAIWAYFSWSLVSPVAVIEGRGGYEACRRSAQLVAADRGRVVLFLVIILFLMLFVGAITTLPAQIFAGMIAGMLDSQVVGVLFGEALGILSRIVLEPLPLIAAVLLYYDQRIRCEGMELPELAKSVKG